jgi:uncharacterized protein YceK
MARTVIPRTLVLVIASVACGCGTVIGNLGGLSYNHCCDVYGGVQVDLEACSANLKEISEPTGGNTRCGALLGGAVLVADIPFSFIADTLTLPWTITATLNGEDRRPKWLYESPSDALQVPKTQQDGNQPASAAP